MLDFFQEGFAPGNAVHAPLIKGNVAFDRNDVVILVLFHRLGQSVFGLLTGRCHNRIVVIERNHRQNEVLGNRVVRTDKGLRTAGALQTVQPNDRGSGFGLNRRSDIFSTGAAESEAGGRQ